MIREKIVMKATLGRKKNDFSMKRGPMITSDKKFVYCVRSREEIFCYIFGNSEVLKKMACTLHGEMN